MVCKQKNGRHLTALHSAARHGQVEIIKFLQGLVDNMHPYDSNGWAPMHRAAFYNQVDVIKYYLESSDIIEKSPKQNNSNLFVYYQREPIHDAAERGHLDVAKLILPYLKDKNPKDANLRTPLHIAAVYGHLDIVKLLTENINDTNSHSSAFWNYETPLHEAAERGYLDIVKYLVQNTSVDPNEKTQNGFFGQTAYEIAFMKQQSDVAKFLAEYIEQKISLPKERICNRNKFKCDNGDCVDLNLICDGMPPQCIDKSDLEYCARNLSSSCVRPKYEECSLIKECFIPDLKKGLYFLIIVLYGFSRCA